MSDLPYTGDDPYVYVSYAREDRDTCLPEIKHLHALGYRVSYADDEPDEERIQEASFVLFLVSACTSDSEEVKAELQTASQASKDGLSIHLEDAGLGGTVGLLLGGFDDVKKFRMKEAFYRRRLETAINASMRRPGVTPPPVQEDPVAAAPIRSSARSGSTSLSSTLQEMAPSPFGAAVIVGVILIAGYLFLAPAAKPPETGDAGGETPASSDADGEGDAEGEEGDGEDEGADGEDEAPPEEPPTPEMTEARKEQQRIFAADTAYTEGVRLLREGENEKALPELNKAIELRADQPAYLIARGEVHYRLKQDDKAIADYDRALKLDPKNVDAYAGRADVYKYSDPAKAILDYSAVIERRPKDVDAWIGRGDAKRRTEDYEGAIADYTEAVTLAPRTAAYYGRSLAKKKLGDAAGAAEDAEKARTVGR